MVIVFNHALTCSINALGHQLLITMIKICPKLAEYPIQPIFDSFWAKSVVKCYSL